MVVVSSWVWLLCVLLLAGWSSSSLLTTRNLVYIGVFLSHVMEVYYNLYYNYTYIISK